MKIAVVGSINLDMTVIVERIPLKGETLAGTDLMHIPGGKGANQAVALARLGGDVEMFGCVGDDLAGKELLENLKIQGVKTDNIHTVKGVPTGIAFITVGEKDNTIVVVAGANNKVDRQYIDSISENLLKSETVLLQHEIPSDTVEYVVDLCYKNNIKIVLNPAPVRAVSEECIKKINYLTPNEHEASILFGENTSLENMLKKYPEKLIVTQGSKGVVTCTNNGEILLIPASKVNVVDTTGAGDTLNGAFTFAISNGMNISDALKFGNIAAGISTQKLGAQSGMPTYKEVMDRFKECNL